MVQGRQVKINYKSKQCRHQNRENWVVVEHTHEPLIDVECFHKVGLLVKSREHTRSRTYNFLLKGLIFCHECGHPLAVVNRPNRSGADVLYFVCRTYQRDTRSGVCTSHCIKEKTVTEAVWAKMQEICADALDLQILRPLAEQAVREAEQAAQPAKERCSLQDRAADLTAHLDQVYADRLSGLLQETDFQRFFARLCTERKQIEERIQMLEMQEKSPVSLADRAGDFVQRYLDTLNTNREFWVSLIERVELTAEKEVLIRFRISEP